MGTFISKLLRHTEQEQVTEFAELEVLEPAPAPREILAVERAHTVITRGLTSLKQDEARLVEEIQIRTEQLRQVRVALSALSGAYLVLDDDMKQQQPT